MSSSQNIPGTLRPERADRIPDAVWEEHRDTIKSLYIDHGMRLEDLIRRMDDDFDFKASEQQYKIQFNRWNLRKNKRRLDQRASSPEPEQPRQPHPNFRSHEYPPYENAQLGDPGSINLGAMGPSGLTLYPNSSNNMGGAQPFGLDPFLMPPTASNAPYLTPYGAQYAPAYVQPAQPSMYGPLQQFHVQSGSQTAQGHFQLNHYNIVDGVGGASQMPARQMSRSSSSTTLKPTRQPIHQAVQSGSLRGAKLLLDANAKCAHVLDNDGISPAWIAAQGGYADILRLLVTHKVDLNVPNHENNRFPIHQAAQAGHTRIVEMLLQNGADPDPVDNHGITPLWSAAQSGHYEIVKMLLNHSSAGEKVDIETESYDGERRPIHQAAQGGHLTIVQFLLAEGAVCDPMDHHGVTPLWTASQNGHADVVRELLKAGAKVDVTAYEYNRLPIHQAAHGGHIEVVRTLMEFGANPTPEADTFDDSEPSPFLLACACENIELVRLFLEFGVKINTTMKGGKGPLHFASHRGNVKVGQLLIDKGCDVDAREADGWTALILAAQEGHLPFVNLLIDNHANVNAEEKDGATALWVAAQQGHANIVRHLLEAGARQLAAKETGRRPIHQAAQNGHLACVKLLLKDSRGELNRAEQDGFTALTLASQKNQPAHLSVMRYLVSQGAKVL